MREKYRTAPVRNGERGFGLLHLAIALSIIGVLAGGIVAARGMIAASENKAIIGRTDEFIAAMQRFHKIYSYYPGDMPNATSFFNGVSNGNGNNRLDGSEILSFWRHLSASGLIKGDFDGQTQKPGVGMPQGTRADLGYEAVNDPVLGLSFVLSRYADGAGGKAALSAQDAWSLDKQFDDGIADAGTIRAHDGTDTPGGCVGEEGYNLHANGSGCVLVISAIRGGVALQRGTMEAGPCGTPGTTRSTKTACPVGYAGDVVETCAADGNWQQSHFNCVPLICSTGAVYEDTRKVGCPDGYSGSITEVCRYGWLTQEDNCVPDTVCETEGARKTVACPIGKVGHIFVECRSGSWDFAAPVESNCTPVACGVTQAGNTQTGSCPVNYMGNVIQLCTLAGSWQNRVSQCDTVENTSCNGVSAGTTRSIDCPPGETGEVVQTCTDGIPSRFWQTSERHCKPVTCDGEPIGYHRVSGKACQDGFIGKVIEVCTANGQWVESDSNCTENVIYTPPPLEETP